MNYIFKNRLFEMHFNLGWCKSHLLSVYWGQDSAGGINLKIEKELIEYCDSFDYDIITIGFVDIFFDRNNKGNFYSSF